jgi:hypothetical protein
VPLPSVVLLNIVVFVCLGAWDASAGIGEIGGDLLDEIEAIRSNMPGRNSEGFDPPTSGDLGIWRMIAEALLIEEVDTADSLVALHFPEYGLFLFTDSGFDSSKYYLLKELFPVTRGWGTLMVRIAYERQIAVEVPHPRYEINTPSEGADVFRRTAGRLFIMAGTHRCANAAVSPCDGSSSVCGDGHYHISDMAHLTESVFQVAHEAFTATYPEGYSFSLHGTGSSSCEDIFLSNGHTTDSQQILYDLRDRMVASGNITVGVAGDGVSSCTLIGSTNVQGRYTNGSPDPCFQGVSSTTGYFIHAEQQRRVRDSLTVYSKLIDAIKETIPPVGTSVTTPADARACIHLSTPRPNPCTGQTRFALTVPRTLRVRVEVFDTLGRLAVVVYDGVVMAGRPLPLEFDAESLPSGIYFVRASSGGSVATQSVTILR